MKISNSIIITAVISCSIYALYGTTADAQRPSSTGLSDIPKAPEKGKLPQRSANEKPKIARSLPFRNNRTDAFEDINDGFQHRLSGLNCANNIEGQRLIERAQFSLTGDRILCNYAAEDGKTTSSYFVAAISSGTTPKSITDDFIESYTKDKPDRKILSHAAVDMNFGGRVLKCDSANFQFQTARGGGKTSIRNCIAGPWRVTVRETWLGDANRPIAIVDRFAAKQKPFMDKVAKCARYNQGVKQMPRSEAKGLTYAADSMEYVAKGDACYGLSTSGKTQAFLIEKWPDNPDTPLTLTYFDRYGPVGDKPFFRVQNMWARVAEDKRGPGGYLMIREDTDGQMTVYSGYNRVPASNAVFAEFDKIMKGQVKANLIAKRKPGGGMIMAAQ